MANLLDTIQANGQPQQQGEEDNTNKLASLLRAKSGRAAEGGAVGQSNLGEQQANVNTNAQLGQVAGQAAVQNVGQQAQQTAQTSDLQNQKVNVAQTNKFNTVQNKLQTNQILQQYEQNKGTLSLAQDKAKADQLGFNLRMQNQQYVDNLTRVGNTARLNSDLGFKQEMAKQTFGDNESLLQTQLGDKSLLDASQQDFEKAMGAMTQDQAYEAFHNAMANEKDRAIYTGIAGVTTAGIGAAAKAGNSSSTPTSTTTSAPTYNSTDTGGSGSMSS